jgi:uncharacterized membrane protein YhaH (DUF805 family)
MAFGGRFTRGDYWHVLISVTLISTLSSLGFFIATARGPVDGLRLLLLVLTSLWFLVSIPIGLGAAVQRLHDLNKSGWWLLLGLVPIANLYLAIIMLFRAGEAPGATAWG